MNCLSHILWLNCFPVLSILLCTFAHHEKDTDQLKIPKEGFSYFQKQLQILKLLNNLNCLRNEDKDLQELSNAFNPLDNLGLYENPDLVQDYFESLKHGQGLRRLDPFANDPKSIVQLVKLFDILFVIDEVSNWDLVYKTAAYASARVNVSLFYWVISTLISSKWTYLKFKSPPTFEVFPQLFIPKEIIKGINGLKLETDKELEEINYPENQLNYFRHDPQLNVFHLEWHVDFPFWWNPVKYKSILKDRKGELFLYMHHQFLNRYNAERLSIKGLKESIALDLDEPIEEGYVASILNINLREFPTREPNSRIQDMVNGTKVKELKESQMMLNEGIDQGFFINDKGDEIPLRNKDTSYNILGATLEASEESVSQNIYGSLHNKVHRIISHISDPNGTLLFPPGVIAHSETAVQDPVFFRIHRLIDNFYVQQSQQLKSYSCKDMEFTQVDLISVRIQNEGDPLPSNGFWPFESNPPTLETYFEDFSYDISNSVIDCDKVNSGMNFTATMRRLNHKRFKYLIKVNSKKSGKMNAIVRIFMSPVLDYDGKPYAQQDLQKNMIEMDKFPVTLQKGKNLIERKSVDSSVIIPDRKGFKILIQETKDSAGKEKKFGKKDNPIEEDRLCGYPEHLLVPKGNVQGMKFKLFVMLTEANDLNISNPDEEEEYPSISLCGVRNGIYPDKKPMGFPFDRKANFGFSLPFFIHQNFKFIDVLVRHNNN